MTTRRSVDLAVPAQARHTDELPANVLDFASPPRLPFTLGPFAVFGMAERQRKRDTQKSVARSGRAARKVACRRTP